MNLVIQAGKFLNITATNTTLKGGGLLLGVFVASTAAGTIKIADASGTIVNTFSPVAATYYQIPAVWLGTLTITITGTVDATIFYNK